MACSFLWARKRVAACSRRTTLAKLLRRMAWLVMSADQRSTRLSQRAAGRTEAQTEARVVDQPLAYRVVPVGSNQTGKTNILD